jgi:hypothetical protein
MRPDVKRCSLLKITSKHRKYSMDFPVFEDFPARFTRTPVVGPIQWISLDLQSVSTLCFKFNVPLMIELSTWLISIELPENDAKIRVFDLRSFSITAQSFGIATLTNHE